MQRIFLIVMLILFFSPIHLSAKINPIELSPPDFPVDEKENRDPQELVAAIKKKIASDPQNFENYGMLAFAYDYIGDYKNELEALKSEVQYLPDDLEDKGIIYGNLARAYMLTDQWEEGKQWLDKADAINSRNFYNRWNAFDYYLIFKKDFKNAALQLKSLQEFYEGEDKDQYYDAYIKSFENSVAPNEIIELFKESVKLEPNNNKTHRALGVAIRNSSPNEYVKNLPSAMKELKIALKLNPQHIPTYISIADTYMLLGSKTNKKADYQKALNWFNKAYQINPKDLRLAYAMGNFFYYTQEYDKAIEKLEYAYANNSDADQIKESLAFAYNGKAYGLYKANEKLEQGLKLINKAIELKPNDGILLGTKAELLYKMGKYAEALELIKRALDLEPNHEEMKRDFQMRRL